MAARVSDATSHPTPFAPPRQAWWLPGPHIPTIYSKLCRRVELPPTSRAQWPTPDGDVLSVERMAGRAGAPRLVVFHGLEGGTHSTYARALLQQAHARGWWADLVLWRTCDGRSVNGTRRAYHSGASDDADVAIAGILRDDPRRTTLLVGVSLGGNVLLKWLGERAANVPHNIRAAAAISVPFDLAEASRRIDRGFSSVYGRHFLRKLRAKTMAKLSKFPDLVDAVALALTRCLWDFDDVVTGPIHGFSSAADYYERSSAMQFLDRVRIPTLLLNAENDPFLPPRVLTRVRSIADRNPYLRCEFPKQGGHVGFVSGLLPWKADWWMERLTLDWLDRCSR
jgi:predicted alpha/beta-fold hydrolase